MIKAVIFDMDGVMIDSEMEYLKYDLEFARTKNPAIRMEQLYGMVGLSREDAWSWMAKEINNGQTWKELWKDFQIDANAFRQMDYCRIYRRETTGLLRQLREYGLRLALASSTRMEVIRKVLDANGIGGYFTVVVSGQQFKRSKPDPEIYHFTAEALGLSERECFVIEDSTYGITAASLAGMKVAALIDERFGFDRSRADYQVKKLTDILPIIEREACIIKRRKEAADERRRKDVS